MGLTAALGCRGRDANEIINDAILLQAGSFTLDDPATASDVTTQFCLDCAPTSFDLMPDASNHVQTFFSASSSNVIGAGIRFGDNGPVHVVPLDGVQGNPSGSLSFDFTVPESVCAELGSICHAVTCSEYAVTDVGTVSAANINQLAIACNDCSEDTCRSLLTSCSTCPDQGKKLSLQEHHQRIRNNPALQDLFAKSAAKAENAQKENAGWIYWIPSKCTYGFKQDPEEIVCGPSECTLPAQKTLFSDDPDDTVAAYHSHPMSSKPSPQDKAAPKKLDLILYTLTTNFSYANFPDGTEQNW